MNEPKDYKAIMLSSTFTDLEEHRTRAIEVIQKLGYFPSVMEFSGAQAEADVVDTSLRMVREAAAYVGIIGFKYGQTPTDVKRNPVGLSVTELEFNEAMRLERPILLFIMGKKHPVLEADVELDPDKREKLNQFRERAKQMREGSKVERVYEVFESLDRFTIVTPTALGILVRFLERTAPVELPAAGQKPIHAISNIPIKIPIHFLGREDDLASIDKALSGDSRPAITALFGLGGVGKTTLAAAYAQRHSQEYRATWWIRAETPSTMRADIVGLGVRFNWVAADTPEKQSVETILDRLDREGDGILLLYDNATTPSELSAFLPRGGGARIIVTSNAPNWGAAAAPIEIDVWSKEVGAAFLIARTRRATEQDQAFALSEALGGLPLAHEQAAAYCERIGISLGEYLTRFRSAAVDMLADAKDVAQQYGRTVTKTFSLAIEQAATRHAAAGPLIAYAALLAPEPIPLYFFVEGRNAFSDSFASSIKGSGLDDAVAALRAFALIQTESVPDERDPSFTTGSLRLHRLVREVAAGRFAQEEKQDAHRQLIVAVEGVYPKEILGDPRAWPRARRLDRLALALVGDSNTSLDGVELVASDLLDKLAYFRQGALAAYSQALLFFERAKALREKIYGAEDSRTARSWNNLGDLYEAQGDTGKALEAYNSALSIREKVLGLDHVDTAESYNNVGYQLQSKGEFSRARTYYRKALNIRKAKLGYTHQDTALSYNNLGYALRAQGNLDGARAYYEIALDIKKDRLGNDHLGTALSLQNLGYLLFLLNDLDAAYANCSQAVAIYEKALTSTHPDTARCRRNVGAILWKQGKFEDGIHQSELALADCESTLGVQHRDTRAIALSVNEMLEALGRRRDAKELRKRYNFSDPSPLKAWASTILGFLDEKKLP